MRNIRELTVPFACSAAHLITIDEPSLSHFGGSPKLPDGVHWPEHNGVPLHFLVRLSLSELQRAQPIDWLPSSGALLFFYDMEEQPWGFDPKDRGRWAVIHAPDLAAPVALDTTGAYPVDAHVPYQNLGFRAFKTLPSWERDDIEALKLTHKEADKYVEECNEVYGELPQHQVGGFPWPVQNDTMELECQLASNGLYLGDSSGYNHPGAAALESGAIDWRLLFQCDSDDDLDLMWGDSGKLYFWIREQDARAGHFADVWLILQCY